MNQKKKIKSTAKQTKKSYFNPYETTRSGSNENSLRSQRSNHTYGKKRTSSLKANSTEEGKVMSKVTPVRSKSQKKRPVERKRTTALNSQKQSSKKNVQTVKRSSKVNMEQMTPEQRRMQMRKKKAPLTKKQREKLRRKRQRQFVFRVALTMCFTVIGVWGLVQMMTSLNKTTISYQTVKVGALDTSTEFEGVIFRDEKVILSEDEGYAKYIVAEGEKVEKNGTIYALVDEENLATTTAAKVEVDSQIYNEAEAKEAIAANPDQRYHLNQEIKSNIHEFYNTRYDQNTSNIYTLRSKLESNIANRTSLYASEQQASNESLIKLKEEIDANLEKYHKGKEVMEAGIVSYTMDGYETQTALSAIEDLNYEAYNEYKKGNNLTTLAPSNLQKEVPIYKLVTSNEWYVVTYIDAKEDQWTLGQKYDLNFEVLEDLQIPFTLASKTEEENRIKLVFKTSNQIGEVLGLRHVEFSIGDKNMTGLKVPVEAVTELNQIMIPKEYVIDNEERTGVYLQKGEEIQFVSINIQEKNGDKYYIVQDLMDSSSIQLNDVLIVPQEGKTYVVTESKVAYGVYVMNNEIAKFKPIQILTQNNEYVLVEYNANSSLKEMDKIISNVKSISKDQLLENVKIQNE